MLSRSDDTNVIIINLYIDIHVQGKGWSHRDMQSGMGLSYSTWNQDSKWKMQPFSFCPAYGGERIKWNCFHYKEGRGRKKTRTKCNHFHFVHLMGDGGQVFGSVVARQGFGFSFIHVYAFITPKKVTSLEGHGWSSCWGRWLLNIYNTSSLPCIPHIYNTSSLPCNVYMKTA